MDEMKKTASVQSLDRGLTVLMAIAEAQQPMSLGALVERTGLERSCVFRLASTLVKRGFCSQSPASKSYTLGPAIWKVAGLMRQSTSLLATARPHLATLANQTGGTAHLSVRQGAHAVSLEHYLSEQMVGVSGPLGRSEPLYCSAVGKALLVDFDLLRMRRLLDEPLPIRTPRTITEVQNLNEEVRIAALKGFAVDDEEHTLGVRCVASPVRDFEGVVVAGLGISAPAERLSRSTLKSVGRLVREAAEALSRDLGYVSLAAQATA